MKKIILATLVFALLLIACEPVSVPDVTDEIPDLITQEPKPEEIPEVKPPADTPPQENTQEEKDILQPIVGKSYTGGPCIINNLPAFDIMVISTSSGYRLSTEVGIYDIIKGADGKYTVEGYVISVSEDGSKVTIGDAIYEGTK
ncbi:MAG: hypothetical protein SPE84_02675 [Bullifex sp.]|nr:hypothetical protein [Bullifex sp.]